VFWLHAHSQSLTKIEGYVYDENGLPLAGAVVELLTGGYATVTNQTGYFSIENLFSGTYQIQVRYVGYISDTRSDIRVEKDTPSRLKFILRPFIGETQAIVITADRSLSGHHSTLQISAQEIASSSAANVGELLLRIPGVQITEEGAAGGRKVVSIRGSNPNQVLVTLDGVILNDPVSGEVDLNQIPLSIVENVSIKKGGASAESGSGSIGGHVAIRTRSRYVEQTNLLIQTGSFGYGLISPSLSGQALGINYYANFEYRRDDGDFPFSYNRLDGTPVSDTRMNAGFTARQAYLKLAYVHAGHSASVQMNVFDSQRGLPGTVYFLTPYARADVKRYIFSGNYSYQTARALLRMQLSSYTNHSEYRNQWPPDPPQRYKTVPPYHTDYQLQSYNGVTSGEWNWLNVNMSKLEVSYRLDQFRDENLLTPVFDPVSETNNRTLGIGLANTISLKPATWIHIAQLYLALRYDRISFTNPERNRRDEYLSPKLGLVLGYEQDWKLLLHANVGRSFRSPTFGDLYYQDFRVRGNADLLPEKSNDFDAGITLGIPWLHQPEVTITYFRQNLQDLIIWELGSFGVFRPTNLNAFIDGWEYELQWPIWPAFINLNLSHIFLNARDRSGRRTTNDKFLIYRPQNTTKISLDIEYGLAQLRYDKRIISERFVTASNTVALPGYTVDDVMLNINFSIYEFDFTAKLMLNNMFNRDYEIIENTPLPGRNWRAGIQIQY
jgi:outer membrane cobalamin receptor